MLQCITCLKVLKSLKNKAVIRGFQISGNFQNVFISYFSDISSLIHEVFGLYDHAKVVDTEVLSAQAKFPNCWVHGCT